MICTEHSEESFVILHQSKWYHISSSFSFNESSGNMFHVFTLSNVVPGHILNIAKIDMNTVTFVF